MASEADISAVAALLGRPPLADFEIVVRDAKGAPVVIRNAPLLCVEILSPEDTQRKTKDRIDDYLAMGVPVVWLADPKLRLGYVYTKAGVEQAGTGVIWADALNLAIDLTPLFAQL